MRGGSERDVSTLDHESRNETMEWGVIVRAACAEGEEVLCCLGYCFAEKLDLEVALGGM
jgi:hypothetical protein